MCARGALSAGFAFRGGRLSALASLLATCHMTKTSPIVRRPWGFTKFVRRQGFHGIYLVTTEADNPVKVGITSDPVDRLTDLQVANFNRLRMHRFWWLPGRRISGRVERAFKNHFAAQIVRGEWFDLPLSDAETFIEDTIRKLGSWAIKQVHMIELMEHRQRRRLRLPAEAPSAIERTGKSERARLSGRECHLSCRQSSARLKSLGAFTSLHV